ncbi:MAG TPA: DedA family protein [Gaiellales bacterium]|nr:DedA family protein [Gaiellales bacterium]
MSGLVDWVTSHGYLLIFVTVTLELLGIPFPAETILITAGAAASAGKLSLPAVMAVAAVAAVLGATGGYWIGRIGGRPLLNSLVERGWPKQQQVLRVEQFFERHGGKSLVGARFIPFIRVFAPWMAGAAHMPVRRFLLWNVAGGVAWVVLVAGAGFVFGKSVIAAAHTLGLWGVAVVIVLAVAALLAYRVRAHG